MNYHGLVKRLDLPAVWIPPRSWNTTTSVPGRSAAPTTTTMCRASMPASSLSGGPAAAAGRPSRFSVDFDYVDEIWHECEFREGGSFTYAVYDSRGQYPGCCYLCPMGRRTPLTEELLTYDVDVSWWVTHAVEPAQPPAQALPVRGRDPDAPALSVPVSISPPPSTRSQGGEEMAAWSPRRAYQQVRAAV
jgi:hypothetical protein